MLGLGVIFKVLLLLVNAMAVLHEERFLNKGMLMMQEKMIISKTFLDDHANQLTLMKILSYLNYCF